MSKRDLIIGGVLLLALILSSFVSGAEVTLVRYGPLGNEQPGLIDSQGQIRDLSAHIEDISPDTLSDAALDEIGQAEVFGVVGQHNEIQWPNKLHPPPSGACHRLTPGDTVGNIGTSRTTGHPGIS